MLIFIAGIYSFYLSSQNHDYMWVLGYESWTGHPDFGNTIINFNSSPPDITYQYTETDFREANASMCDEDGVLQFYTNGLSVTNKLHETMENGNGLSPGEYADGMADGGYHLWQGMIALPAPGVPGKHYLLHSPKEYATADLDWHSPVIYYSLIDMAEEGGLGKVVEKNVPLVTDTLGQGQLTAVRHGNGRDWWLLDHEFESSSYHRILVDPWGVHSLGTASTGEALPEEGLGQSVFTPDGTKYIRNNLIGGTDVDDLLDIYDFDRCTGALGNHVRIAYGNGALSGGVAVSPNSRFLYVSHHTKIYQFDLLAADIAASKQVAAVYDGFTDDGFATRFYLAQLAPDGRIYICSPTSTRYLHVIHQPDLPFPDCNVEQHGVQLPRYNRYSIPNFPNYRLGPLTGSPCDTLGLASPPAAAFGHAPDPDDPLRIEFNDQSIYAPTAWDWDFGDSATSTAQHTARKYAAAGVYEVCLTAGNAFGADTVCQLVQVGTVAAGERTEGIAITVFPNPASESVNVILPEGLLPMKGRFTLFDQLGRPCLSRPVRGGWNSILLDGIAPGLYFYEVNPDSFREGDALLLSGPPLCGKLVVE